MIPSPGFAISPAELLQQLAAMPPAPPIAPPPVAPQWMEDVAEAMTSEAWFELQALAEQMFPHHQRHQTFLTSEQRKEVQRAWQKRLREAEQADLDAKANSESRSAAGYS